jgi:hypothetical protein
MHTRSRISASQPKNEPLETNSEPLTAGEIQWPVRKTRISRNQKDPTESPVKSKVDLENTASSYNALMQNGGIGSEDPMQKDPSHIENRPTKRNRVVTALLKGYPLVNPSIESIKDKPSARRKSRRNSLAETPIPSTDTVKSAPSSETMEGSRMEDTPAKLSKARAKSIEPGSLKPPAGIYHVRQMLHAAFIAAQLCWPGLLQGGAC